ncbi:oligosaccharide repeat unit polymerase [Candidatus Wolfebacteria bacterium]|nr:oligosaccharide repeat unit polymerase [Candidatus Wolfebacteria bacterium]
MKKFWLENIKKKNLNFDYFELGNSAALYYILIFLLLPLIVPLALILNNNSVYVKYIFSQNVPVYSIETFIYLLIGILFLLLGYKFFSFKNLTFKISNLFKKDWDFKRTFLVFSIVFLINIFIKAIRIFNGGYFHLRESQNFINGKFYSLIGLLDWFGPISLAMAFTYYFFLYKTNDYRYKIWQKIAWAAFLVEFFYGFFSLNRFRAIIPVIIYLIVRHYVYDRSFKRIIIFGILIFFILMPVANFYKNPGNFYFSAGSYKNKTELEHWQFIFESSIGRFNQSKIILNVFDKTDKFLHGKSLENFFISLGPPRFIWKNKPITNDGGNKFGRKYGIISPDNFQTSVGPTIIGDLYMNFGIMGIALGMLFFGALFRFIFDSLIGKTNILLSGVVIYSVFWIQIIKGSEDFIAPVWAGLIKLFVILLFIHFLLVGFKKNNNHQ